MANQDDDGKLSATELSQAALATVQELTGYKPEAVIGLEWDGDLWQVRVDVLELERVPNTTDMIGEYLVSLDEDGTLRGYKRISRFQRGKPMDEG
jgi:hypothetical protein